MQCFITMRFDRGESDCKIMNINRLIIIGVRLNILVVHCMHAQWLRCGLNQLFSAYVDVWPFKLRIYILSFSSLLNNDW